MYINNNSSSISINRNLTLNNVQDRRNKTFGSAESIGKKIHAQIEGLEIGSRNALDGINMLNVAEGGLSIMTDMTQRVRELTIQGLNYSEGSSSREIIGNEIKQMLEGMQDIANNTEYNTKKLLDGSNTDGISLQIGSNEGNLTKVNIDSSTLDAIGLEYALELDFKNITREEFGDFLENVDKALDNILDNRGGIGAHQNGLSYGINSTDITQINLSKYMTNKDVKNSMTSVSKELLTQIDITLKVKEDIQREKVGDLLA